LAAFISFFLSFSKKSVHQYLMFPTSWDLLFLDKQRQAASAQFVAHPVGYSVFVLSRAASLTPQRVD
jgi:hypothetical protein